MVARTGPALRLTRQKVALSAKTPAPPKYDPAQPAVQVSELKAVLDKDLAAALKAGPLAPTTGGGVVMGWCSAEFGGHLFTARPKADSLFEIGSISKTFTGLMLAQMVAQKKAMLDEPVRELLPPGTVAKPEGQRSPSSTWQHNNRAYLGCRTIFIQPIRGIPMRTTGRQTYTISSRNTDVRKPADANFNYSNLGLGFAGPSTGRTGPP